MTSHSAVEEQNININDKAGSQEEYSRPSSASQHEEAVVEEPKMQPTKSHDLTPDQETQADVRSMFTAESGIPPAPDGGLHAWLKVFGGFMIYINIWYVSPFTTAILTIHPTHSFQEQPT